MKRFLKIFAKQLLKKLGMGVGYSPLNFKVVPDYTYKIIKVYSHDQTAFTQGLVFENGFLYESTGLHGRSTLRKVHLESGNILQLRQLPPHLFGEGLTIYDNKIIQLTWQSKTGFAYDKENFELLREFKYSTEGWGLTHNHKHLIMSDGTSKLRFLNPETFQEIGWINVNYKGKPVHKLNELQYIKGEIFANIWRMDYIARIAPETGQVIGWIKLNGLLSLKDSLNPEAILNGIAYDQNCDRLFVTGKLWSKLFEIRLVPVR